MGPGHGNGPWARPMGLAHGLKICSFLKKNSKFIYVMLCVSYICPVLGPGLGLWLGLGGPVDPLTHICLGGCYAICADQLLRLSVAISCCNQLLRLSVEMPSKEFPTAGLPPRPRATIGRSLKGNIDKHCPKKVNKN